jgi:hypothetical protein
MASSALSPETYQEEAIAKLLGPEFGLSKEQLIAIVQGKTVFLYRLTAFDNVQSDIVVGWIHRAGL